MGERPFIRYFNDYHITWSIAMTLQQFPDELMPAATVHNLSYEQIAGRLSTLCVQLTDFLKEKGEVS